MKISQTPTDGELLRLMMAGDEDAFTALYRRRQGQIYRFALHMSGSTTIAEDVTQEVFIALMREAASYDPERGPLAAYLYGMARNQVLRALDRDRSLVPVADYIRDEETRELIATDGPLENLARGEMIEQLRHAVLALPIHYREVVVLCELQEINYAAAAALLNCAVGTVRSRLHRARALLGDKLRAKQEAETSSERAVSEINQNRCLV